MHVFILGDFSFYPDNFQITYKGKRESCCVLLLLPFWLSPISLIPLMTVREDVALEEKG